MYKDLEMIKYIMQEFITIGNLEKSEEIENIQKGYLTAIKDLIEYVL